jgi:hypothetical protein
MPRLRVSQGRLAANAAFGSATAKGIESRARRKFAPTAHYRLNVIAANVEAIPSKWWHTNSGSELGCEHFNAFAIPQGSFDKQVCAVTGRKIEVAGNCAVLKCFFSSSQAHS